MKVFISIVLTLLVITIMEARNNEQSHLPEVTVKTEPLDQNNAKSDIQQTACTEKEYEQRIECTTESQETETRTFLSKCVFCGKTFTIGDDPKLLECLHAACTTCVNNKITDHNTSVDVDILCKYNYSKVILQ